jgi:hypothetical protein
MALANAANPKVEFKVRIVGFSQGLEFFNGPGLSRWTPVTEQTLSSLDTSADKFRTQNNGDYTNFANALAGSEALLGPQSTSCKALLWFTDGANDESNNGQVVPTQPIERQNTQQICQAGGIADAIVNDDIYSFAVGLTNQTGSAGQRELQTIVEGQSTAGPDPDYSGRCGQNGVSDSVSTQTGKFFNSPTAQQLIINMQEMFSPTNASGVGPGPGGVCLANERCPAADLSTFWVGPGVKDFFIDTDALGLRGTPTSGETPQLVLTDVATGQSIRFARSTKGTVCYTPQPHASRCSVGGVSVVASSITGGELAVTGDVPSDLPASGVTLRLTILTPTGSSSTQYLFYETPSVQMNVTTASNATSQSCPADDSTSLLTYIECPTNFSVDLVTSSNGEIFHLGSLSNLSATIPGTSVPTIITTQGDGAPLIGFTMPTGSSPGRQSIQLRAVLHLGPKGFWPLTLGDTSVFDLRTQPGYPTVVLPSHESTLSPGQSKLTVVTVKPGSGGANGGCFEIKGITESNLAGLRASANVPNKWKESCVPLPKDRAIHFAMITKLDGATTGGPFDVNLSVVLGSASTSGSRINLSYHARLRAFLPLNVGRSILLLLLLLAGGVLLLLSVALGVNLLTGRFAPLNVIMLHGFDVVFNGDGSDFVEPDDQTKVKVFGELTSRYDIEEDKERTKRTFSADGLTFRAVLGSSFGAKIRGLINGATGTVRYDSNAPLIVGTSKGATSLHAGPQAIALSLDGTWIFRPTAVTRLEDNDFTDSPQSSVRSVGGHLTFIIREGADSRDFRQLRQSAFRELSNGIDQYAQSETMSRPNGSVRGQTATPKPSGESWSDDL